MRGGAFLNGKEGRVGFRKYLYSCLCILDICIYTQSTTTKHVTLMLEVKDLCTAYLEGYIQCKVSEYLLHDKVLSSDLDMIKEMAVKCMEQYISQQKISEADKEKMKQNHKQWAEKVLQGVKQRLHECGKIK